MTTTNSCLIFIPVYRLPLTNYEQAALIRCLQLLAYDICLAFPISLYNDISRLLKSQTYLEFDNILLKPYPNSCFKSISSYNKMLLSKDFYKNFKPWTYLLIFQLDAWLLGGDLGPWLQSGYTYIGAPWPPLTGPDKSNPYYRVGNGGLSLRRIDHILRLHESWRFRSYPVFTPLQILFWLINRPSDLDLLFCTKPKSLLSGIIFILFSILGYHNNLDYFIELGLHEDHLYGLLAARSAPWFRVAPASVAAAFSIECKPMEVLAHFGIDMPFGCHAWEKYDREFFLQRFPVQFSSLPK